MSDMEAQESILDRTYVRYAIAVAAVGAAFLLRIAITGYISTALPSVTFYPAVMLTAILAGFWPGVLATILSALVIDYWFIPPTGSFAVSNPSQFIALSLFLLTGAFMSFVAEAYRRSERRNLAYERERTLRESGEKLRQSEQQFETLANAIPQLCWMANPDGGIFWYNQRWYEYTGTTPEQMEGWGWQSVHDPTELPRVLREWKSSLATGEPLDTTFPLKSADGKFRPFLTRVMPITDSDGNVVRWFGTNTDIGAQKQVEAELRASTARLNLALEVANLGEWDVDLKSHIGSHSQRHSEIFGYDSPQQGWNFEEFIRHVLPQHRASVTSLLKASLQRGSWDFETQILREDGEVRWIWARGCCALDESAEPARMYGTVMDITERRQADETLRQHADMLKLSFDAIIIWRIGGRIELWNRGAEQLYGYSEQEALGKSPHDLLRTTPPGPWSEIEGWLHEHGNWEGEVRHFTRQGRQVTVSARLQVIVSADGSELILETNRDITQRKLADEALRSSQAKLQSIVSSAMDAVISVDERQRILVFNQSAETVFECKASDAIGSTLDRFIPEKLREIHQEHVRRFGAEGTTARSMSSPGILTGLRTTGEEFPIEATISKVRSDGESLYTVILRDITERKRSEQALRASERRWATTLESIGDAVISTDASGHVEFMNEVAQRLTGWTLAEAKGIDLSRVFNIIQEDTRTAAEDPVSKVLRLSKVVGLANHTALVRRDGQETPIEDSAAPIRDKDGQIEGVVLVFHDVSEQRRAEKAMRLSDRLATTGRLAATIAHEIHNPLDAVSNLLYLIGQDSKEDATREYVAMASRELVRITQMTQRMLAFQREAAKPIPVKVADILQNVVELYERRVKSAEITLKLQIKFDGLVRALPGELRQMFANLVGNAIEAVTPKRGKITLRAYASRDWRSGRLGLRVTLADNGPGIPDNVRARIFEPFFTTKGESGTGLGLWIASDILRKYDGALRLRTSTRRDCSGTCFSIFLPF